MRVFNYRKQMQSHEKKFQEMKMFFELSFALNGMYPHENSNTHFKKQKLSLLIFSCSKSTIRLPKQGAKYFKN